MSEAAVDARHKANMFRQSLTCLQEKLAAIEAKPVSTSMTWDEEEVQELEGVIAELTAQLQELKDEAKANEREFERNRGMVANMGRSTPSSRDSGIA